MEDEYDPNGGGWTSNAQNRGSAPNSAPDVDETIPVPEYEIGQYFPQNPKLTDTERKQFREEYGYIQAYYKTRPAQHRKMQWWLNQSRIGETYDVYLTRATKYALLAGVVGALLGILFSFMLSTAGILGEFRSPVLFSGELVDLGRFLSENKVWFGSLAITLVVGSITGLTTWTGFYYYPWVQTDSRRRNIEFNLSHGIVYMYALSRGGMNLLEVVDRLADSKDTYGAVADEFDMIRRDVELFGNDLYTALRNARNITPSDSLEQFFDDLISILESGGDATEFLEDQSETYLRRAEEEQTSFLETLSILSEVFIVTFVAAPLFFIVILIVIGILGGEVIPQLYALIYGVLPFGMAGYLVLISTLSEPYTTPATQLEATKIETDRVGTSETLKNSEEYKQYQAHNRKLRLQRLIGNPLTVIRENPMLTLVFSVPVAVVVLALQLLQGVPDISAEPVSTTTALFVIPFLIVATPLSFFHEYRQGYREEIGRRFPDMLNVLSSANNMGISLPEALDVISRWAGGRFGNELRAVRNDIRWNNNPADALVDFAVRLRIPEVARTIKLIAEGTRASSDLARVLSIAAEDTRNRFRMRRTRRNSMTAYTAVVLIGYLVFLMVIVMLDSSYLTPIAELSSTPTDPDAPGVPIGFQELPIETFRMLFFHSVLIQGIGSGLLVGELSGNDIISGLKYSVLLVGVATAVFVVF